jgi:hypothetical protein
MSAMKAISAGPLSGGWFWKADISGTADEVQCRVLLTCVSPAFPRSRLLTA